MSKCAWLVDMGYVVKTAKKVGMKIDYVAAVQVLQERYEHAEAFLFNGYDDAIGIPAGLKGFYQAMEKQGMAVRLHPMTGDAAAGTHRQRRVDVDFASHAVWQSSLPDVGSLVLTTGDQDMIPAVELCRLQLGVEVVLFTFAQDVSQSLINCANDQMLFENYRAQLGR